MADVPAFPVDAPVVTVLEQGENPQLLEYTYASFESPEANWHTTLEVAGGIDQAVAAEGENVDPEAPAGGAVYGSPLVPASTPIWRWARRLPPTRASCSAGGAMTPAPSMP